MPQLLSKSKYLTGLQCPRLIWTQFHEPEKIPETDPVTQHIFDQGHLVGELAKKLFPEGIDISTDDFMGNIASTMDLLKNRKPLFEAGILAGKLYSRVDILYPIDEEGWDIVEVKSSTSVKDVHINDVAYQRYCCNQSGLNITKCCLALINNQYVKDGEIDPEGLFSIHDVTDQVEEAIVGIQDRIDGILEVINQKTCPEMIIGPHCRDPYECPLEECWEHLPEGNVFTLYYSGKKSFDLYDKGIVSIKDIPSDYKLSEKQAIQKESLVTGETHLDKGAIKGFLASLEHPLYYMDFETINPAVPLFDGTRPYQHTPFQFSVHVVRDMNSNLKHFSFLAEGTQDPKTRLLEELQKVLGDSGSIIAYNKGFEEGILKGLGKTFPEYEDWINQILSRMVDLLTPFRNFDYYHPGQEGSASLKAVLPAVTGKGYEDLDINDGQLASISFLSATFGDMPADEKIKVMTDLEQYCGRDTEGMIWIVERLEELYR